MFYIESPSVDPEWNLALEQYIFDTLGPKGDCFILWQNDNAIIIGKHQNTIQEINADYVNQHGIKVVRRLSGGGAVYHDLGNVNFTFISRHAGIGFDFSTFCIPVAAALRSIGVPAEINGRNDMTIDGRKFSGNSQYVKRGLVMHHGTLMFDSDLDVVNEALKVRSDKIESKGLKSVRSRVTNIKPYAPKGMTVEMFKDTLVKYMRETYKLDPYILTEKDIAAIDKIKKEIYSTWEWNYGHSPRYSIIKTRRFEGVGGLEIHMNVESGKITALKFYGDYFGNGDSGEIAARLIGAELNESALKSVLSDVNISDYFANMSVSQLIEALLK